MKIIQQTTRERNLMYLLIAVASFLIGFMLKKPDIIITATQRYDRPIEFPDGQKYNVTFNWEK